jgi:hypothetical protein
LKVEDVVVTSKGARIDVVKRRKSRCQLDPSQSTLEILIFQLLL